jgi:hypothetical protein
MSFDWNLSDGDNDDDEDFFSGWDRRSGYGKSEEKERDDVGEEQLDNDGVAAAASAGGDCGWNDWTLSGGVDSEEEEPVDWEDANAGSDDDDDDRKPSARSFSSAPLKSTMPFRGNEITIDLSSDLNARNPDESNDDNKNKKKTIKQRRKNRLPLDPESQELVRDLSRSYLLTMVSRAAYLSKVAADATLQAVLSSVCPLTVNMAQSQIVAASLSASLPSSASQQRPCRQADPRSYFHPSVEQVQNLVAWFGTWEYQRSLRLAANARAGAPLRRRRGRASSRKGANGDSAAPSTVSSLPSFTVSDAERWQRMACYWSDPDPQLTEDGGEPTTTGSSSPSVARASNDDRVGMFVALARSMNWRVRFVSSFLNPLAPDASLDVDHPLLGWHDDTMFRLFRHVASSSIVTPRLENGPSKRTKKRGYNQLIVAGGPAPSLEKVRNQSIWAATWGESNGSASRASSENREAKGSRSSTIVTPPESVLTNGKSVERQDNSAGINGCAWSFAEILCALPLDRNKSSTLRRWIHVDPVRNLVQRPDLVEAIAASIQRSKTAEKDGSPETPRQLNRMARKASATHAGRSFQVRWSKWRRVPVAYVVAVEHAHPELYHVTDVTPRYSSSWVASVRLRNGRGHTGRQAARNLNSDWWRATLERLNGGPDSKHMPSFRHKATTKQALLSRGSVDDPIVLDDDAGVSQKGGASVEEAIVLHDDYGDALGSNASFSRNEPTADSASRLFDADEARELHQSTSSEKETIPTSKAAFAQHPVFALASVLGKSQVLHPDAKKRVCGVFKGECVYRRDDVSLARPARRWLYEGRRVREEEMEKPVRQIKARKKPARKLSSFRPLDSYGVGIGNDGSEAQQVAEIAKGSLPLDDYDEENEMQNLYGIWQTDSWSPPTVGPNDPIPVHETHGTIELALLNPGLIHLDHRGLAPVAKQLGIPYAPCHVGFEGQGGNRVPTIRGIVVHEHNAPLLHEARMELSCRAIQHEHDRQRDRVCRLWKRLMRGLLVKDRIEREYADGGEQSSLGC